MRPLVIDKSFSHATKAEALQALSGKYTFVVPSAFYYEIFDSSLEKRQRAIKGFGEFMRVDIASELRAETESGRSSTQLKSSRLSFNPKLLSPEWKLGPAETLVLQKYKTEVVNPLITFWNTVIDNGIVGFTSDELLATKGSDPDFLLLCQKLREPERIRSIASELNFKHATILDETWLHYRQFQAWILHGLILKRRHKNPGDVRSLLRLEHDVHDIEYLMLGLYFGRLATAETSNDPAKASISWRFEILRPTGMLVHKA